MVRVRHESTDFTLEAAAFYLPVTFHFAISGESVLNWWEPQEGDFFQCRGSQTELFEFGRVLPWIMSVKYDLLARHVMDEKEVS